MENNQKFLEDSLQYKYLTLNKRHTQSICEENRTQDKIKISVVAITASQTDYPNPDMWTRGLQCLTSIFSFCFKQKKSEYDNYDDIQDEEITK